MHLLEDLAFLGAVCLLFGCATATPGPDASLLAASAILKECSDSDLRLAREMTPERVLRVEREYISVHVGKGLGEKRLVGARLWFRADLGWDSASLIRAGRCAQAAFLEGSSALPADELWIPGRWTNVRANGPRGFPGTITLILTTTTGDAADEVWQHALAFIAAP